MGAVGDTQFQEVQESIRVANQVLSTEEAWILSRRLEDLLRVHRKEKGSGGLRAKGTFHETAVLGYLSEKGYNLLENELSNAGRRNRCGCEGTGRQSFSSK